MSINYLIVDPLKYASDLLISAPLVVKEEKDINYINKIITILNQSLKGEKNSENLNLIKNLSEDAEKKFKPLLTVVYKSAPEEWGKSHKKIKTKALQVLKNLEKTKSLAEKKYSISNARQVFNVPEEPSFCDHILKKLMFNQENATFINSIVERIRLRNEFITQADINTLNDLIKASKREPYYHFLLKLDQQIKDSISDKVILFNQVLKKYIDASNSFAKKDIDNYDVNFQLNHYRILYHQVAYNPLEMMIDPEIIFKQMPSSVHLENLKKIVSIKTPLPHDENTITWKIEGLLMIRDLIQQKNKNTPKEEILISGAGPGGLITALILSVQGKDFQIIESRKKDAKMRHNILALGKDNLYMRFHMLDASRNKGGSNAADLQLLDFFGVTDALVMQEKIKHKPDSLLSVSIKDLQEHMIAQLARILNRKDLIQYGTKIVEIRQGENPNQPVSIVLESSLVTEEEQKGNHEGHVQNVKEIHPNIVYVMEGGKSPTRDKLGIDMIQESDPSSMGFAFLENIIPTSLPERIYETIVRYLENLFIILKSIPMLLRMLWNDLKDKFANYHILQYYENLFTILGRAELLLETPGKAGNYFYFTIPQKASEQIDFFKQELNSLTQDILAEWKKAIQTNIDQQDDLPTDLRGAMQGLKDSLKNDEWIHDPKLRKEVFQSLRNITKEYGKTDKETEKVLKEVSKKIDAANKVLTKIEKSLDGLIKGVVTERVGVHKLRFSSKQQRLKYLTTDTAISEVQHAERSFLHSGQTYFYIGGDAESTTDPISGSGCRTTLLRALIATNAFQSPKDLDDPLMRSIFHTFSYKCAKSMREEGLFMRLAYRKGTERIERYLDLAHEASAISADDEQFLVKMQAKAEIIKDNPEIHFSKDELEKLNSLTVMLHGKNRSIVVGMRPNLYPLNVSKELLDDSKAEWKDFFEANRKVFQHNSGWTDQERDLYLKVWNKVLFNEEIQLTPKEEKVFNSAAAKRCFTPEHLGRYLAPESWFVPLIVKIKQIQALAINPKS